MKFIVRNSFAILLIMSVVCNSVVPAFAIDDERVVYNKRLIDKVTCRYKYHNWDNQIINEETKKINGKKLYGAVYCSCPEISIKSIFDEKMFDIKEGDDPHDPNYVYSYANWWCYRIRISKSKNSNKYQITHYSHDDSFSSLNEIYSGKYTGFELTSDIYTPGTEDDLYNVLSQQNMVVFNKGEKVYFHLDFCCDYRELKNGEWTEYRAVDEGNHIIEYTIPAEFRRPEIYACRIKNNIWLCYYVEGDNCVTQYRYKGQNTWKKLPKASGKSTPIIKTEIADNNINDFELRCRTWGRVNGKRVYSKWSKIVHISSNVDDGWFERG